MHRFETSLRQLRLSHNRIVHNQQRHHQHQHHHLQHQHQHQHHNFQLHSAQRFLLPFLQTVAMSSLSPSNAAAANNGGLLSKLRKRFSTLGSPPSAKAEAQGSGTAVGTPSVTATKGSANDVQKSTTQTKQDQAPPPPPAKDDAQTFKPATSTTAPAPVSGATVPSSDTGAAKTTAPSPSTPANSSYNVKTGLRTPYPAIEPFKTGTLKVDDLHELYWEVSGNPDGVPVVFLHGGPGAAASPSDRQWFDPKHYSIHLFDQRGCGKSTPHAELTNNTTWDIVEDIEKLRQHFGHAKWHAFGGSWGSCLALAYAQKHPDRILSLFLRGIFTLRRSELQFFYQDGSSHIFPDQFAQYAEHIPQEERGDFIKAYYKRLTSEDRQVRIEAAKHWTLWEMSTLRLYIDENLLKRAESDEYAEAFARVECHFFINEGWMEDGQLLKQENVDKIRSIPAVIIQGRYDVVCPAKTAYDLHKVWPEAEYHLIPDAAHASSELGIAHRLIEATDKARSIKKLEA